MKNIKSLCILGASVVLLLSCEKKEDLTVVQQELESFRLEWTESGNLIRQTLDSVKLDMQGFHDLQVKLDKLKKGSKNLKPQSKTDLDNLIARTDGLRDSLTVEQKSFNELTAQWNEKKSLLGALQEQVIAKTTTKEKVDAEITTFRDFRMQAVEQLETFIKQREHYNKRRLALSAEFSQKFPPSK